MSQELGESRRVRKAQERVTSEDIDGREESTSWGGRVRVVVKGSTSFDDSCYFFRGDDVKLVDLCYAGG